MLELTRIEVEKYLNRVKVAVEKGRIKTRSHTGDSGGLRAFIIFWFC